MKALNYDMRTLIMQNVKSAEKKPLPDTYTKSQYRILRNLVIQKGITEKFFRFIMSGLFGKADWKTLTYSEMYE